MAKHAPKPRSRRIFAWTFAFFAAALCTYVAFSYWAGARPKASLPTFVSDLQRARTEARGNIHVFAFRFSHATDDALKGVNWGRVEEELRRQGGEVVGSSPLSFSLAFPNCAFKLGEVEFVPTVHLSRPFSEDPDFEPTVTEIRRELLCRTKKPYSDLIAKLPSSSVIARELRRGGFAAMASRYPLVGEISLRHAAFGPRGCVDGSILDTRIELRRESMRHDESITISSAWLSGIEPVPRRLLSWIPVSFSFPRDSLDHYWSMGDKGEYKSQRQTYTLHRMKGASSEPPAPTVAYSSRHFASLPASTESIRIEFAGLDPALLAGKRNLKRIEAGIALSDASLRGIVKHPGLKELAVRMNPRLSPLLTKENGLTKLILLGDSTPRFDPVRLTRSKNLQELTLSRDFGIQDDFLIAAAKMPSLTHLRAFGRGSFTRTGLRALSQAPRLQALTLNLARMSPGMAEALSGSRQLRSLNIIGADLSVADLQAIASMRSLRELTLTRCRGIASDRMLLFAKAKHLESISFNSCPGVDARGLHALKDRLGEPFSDPEDN